MQTETITLVGPSSAAQPDHRSANEWWERYVAGLSNISSTARAVLNSDADYIVKNGVFGAGGADGDFSKWPSTRLRKGLVMGAVQSGKTASLLGVVAKALDANVDMVVVLGGTRIALWKQTYRRLLTQLDFWSAGTDLIRRRRRTLLPAPQLIDGDEGLDSIYSETPNFVKRGLLNGRPVVAVVMKQPDHLERFARFIGPIVEQVCNERERPFHLLVVDDEADDGSILDSDNEVGEPIESTLRKQIPRRVARLWSDRDPGAETFNSKLHCTYIAYTATPQSNLLQADHNPLAPSDFICALRAPGGHGDIAPREPSYFEPKGLEFQYTGGEIFYAADGLNKPFCTLIERLEREEQESVEEFEARESSATANHLADSLRSYFVAGAIRLLYSAKRLSALADGPLSYDEMKQRLPSPHSMLIHPGAQVHSHFEAASLVAEWAGGEAKDWDEDGNRFDALQLTARLEREEPMWKAWLQRFRATKSFLADKDGAHALPAPRDEDWPQIKEILKTEVFPFTQLFVINSDPKADESPDFSPREVGAGKFDRPRNVYSIFVSGNVMARGLTLEGLTTTLFLRSSASPAADSQMQMQRWFGYRGSYLNLCHVFLHVEQFQLFLGYHEADEALRREILGYMNDPNQIAPKPTVLQGVDFRATGKIANLRALPLSPGADVFLRVAESGGAASANEQLLAVLLAAENWTELDVGGTKRGIFADRQFSLVEAAELLERFRYSNHQPTVEGISHRRWRSLELQHQIDSPRGPLFRSPFSGLSVDVVPPNACPYSVAAYLRLWDALLTRRARGICPTDRPDTPWSMIDLANYRASAPKFTIAVRYGAADLAQNAALSAYGIQRMERSIVNGKFVSTWGSRNPGTGVDSYLGDQLFDYHITGRNPPIRIDGEPIWRPRGDGGLILFHVVKPLWGSHDIVTAGVSIPLGGPDHIAALRGIS